MKIVIILIFNFLLLFNSFCIEKFIVKANQSIKVYYPVWIEKGKTVKFSVNGKWTMWHPEWKSVTSEGHTRFKKINKYYLGSLVGYIPGGEIFLITDGLEYTSVVSGYLIMYPNRGNYVHLDTDGFITIEITGAFNKEKKINSWESEVIENYKNNYLGSQTESIEWTGSVKKCEAGKISYLNLENALRRINYFRESVGLYPVVFDDKLNNYSQAAALMLLSNHDKPLTHYSSKDWNCYTDIGAAGLEGSNLSRSSLKNLITIFIWDPGSSNYLVGHRRWLLYSNAAHMGYGLAYDKSIADDIQEAVYVIYHSKERKNYSENKKLPEYIAYPPAGYFPMDLIFERFSFGLPLSKYSVDFSNTDIEMMDSWGEQIKIKKYGMKKNEKGVGDPSIVWEIAGGKSKLQEYLLENIDREITIKITNIIIDGSKKDFNYKIIPIVIY